LAIAWHLRDLFGEQFKLENVVRLLQNRLALEALRSASDPLQISSSWKDELAAFDAVRQKYLLYR
jgi:hypothetical protein